MNTKTIRMSTLVRKARDLYLWDGSYDYYSTKTQFSCHAISDAFDSVTKHKHGYDSTLDKIDKKLIELGCDIYSSEEFDDFKPKEDRQAARFMWLSFVIEATKNVKLKL